MVYLRWVWTVLTSGIRERTVSKEKRVQCSIFLLLFSDIMKWEAVDVSARTGATGFVIQFWWDQ
jgi:hypothetical protein